jgi:predicted DNA-binding ribbon-helix-helix protein
MSDDPATIRKHSVLIAGHNTSVTLENAFWDALCEIARMRKLSINDLVAEIDRERSGNLSSAIRLYVFARVNPD